MFSVITGHKLWELIVNDSHSEDWCLIIARFEVLLKTHVFLDVTLCHWASSSRQDHLTPKINKLQSSKTLHTQ
jgi:hypothetical protein